MSSSVSLSRAHTHTHTEYLKVCEKSGKSIRVSFVGVGPEAAP